MNNQELFDYMLNEHGVTLLTGDMHEIENICKEPIRLRIAELKEKISMHLTMKNAADEIRKKNIGISITMLEFAVSQLQELLK